MGAIRFVLPNDFNMGFVGLQLCPRENIWNGIRIAAGLRGVAIFLCTLLASEIVWGATSAGGVVTRVLSLADMGLLEQVPLSNRNYERHFYFSVPQGVVLKNAHVDIHGTYLHPFDDAAAMTLLINGVPVFTRRLPGGDDRFFLKLVDLNGATFPSRRTDEQGDTLDISLPLRKLHMQNGFLDLGVVLSSKLDATHCIDERRRGNELFIDPKVTRLVYSFESDSVRDVRSLLTTLPRHPVILLPHRKLNTAQYGATLRLSQALSGMGLQPRFVAIPQVGDVVDTALLGDAANVASVRIPDTMANAIAQRQPYKIVQPGETAVWLALRMMSPDGLAQVMIDPAQIRQALLAALQRVDRGNGLGKRLWRELRLDDADGWLGKAHMRVAMLAGQSVLILESEDAGKGGDLLASIWRQIAGSRELLLQTVQQLSGKDSSPQHIHFAQNLLTQNVSGQGEWVMPIRLSSIPQGKWPDSLELNLMAAPDGDSLPPVVSVFMNDNLLTAALLRIDGEISRLRAPIPLYTLRANNMLRIEIRRRVSGGHCNGIAQGFPVQLLPSSYLNLYGAQAATQFFMLGAAFGRDSEIAIPAHYLRDALNTLPTVSSVLRGLSFDETDFKLVVTDAKSGFKPSHTFVAFETALDSDTQQVVAGNGRLVVRNKDNHAVFDSTGLDSLVVLQLIRSGRQDGVSVITVDGTLPVLSKPLELSAGSLAIADAGGVRLAINLDDPENDWQLDEQNRGAMNFMQRYRTWFVVFGLLLLPVAVVLGLRWYFQSRRVEG